MILHLLNYPNTIAVFRILAIETLCWGIDSKNGKMIDRIS